MLFVLISIIRSYLVSIRGVIKIITSNYRLVDDNFICPVILFRSPVFHDTFWNDKVSLSFVNHNIFYIFNCLHFISLCWFSNIMIGEDCNILMRDRCIKSGDLRSFFPPPSMEPLALSFGFVSLTTVCDFFFSWFSYYYYV